MDTTTRNLERAAINGDALAQAKLARQVEREQFAARAQRNADASAKWAVLKAEREAEETALRADPIGKFARRFSPCGPCFVSSGVKSSGRIVRQTAKFFVSVGSMPDDKPSKVRKDKVHLRPCSSCPGGSNYPHGYMD